MERFFAYSESVPAGLWKCCCAYSVKAAPDSPSARAITQIDLPRAQLVEIGRKGVLLQTLSHDEEGTGASSYTYEASR